MTYENNIREDVWQHLGPAKYLLGRRRIDCLVDCCVREWWHETFAQCHDDLKRHVVATRFAQYMAEETYGSLLAMLFVGIVSGVVQALLRWWLDDRMRFAVWTIDMQRTT